TDVIAQHNTELQRTAQEGGVREPGPEQEQDDQRPGTKVNPQDVPQPGAEPAGGALRDEIVPARRRGTSQHAGGDPQQVSADLPGPVFTTGGRASSAFAALLFAALVGGAAWVANLHGVPIRFQFAFQLGLGLLVLCAVVELVRTAWPRLRLKINPDGLRVSRAALTR